MLTLSRRPGESVEISHPAGPITIRVTHIKGNKVLLSFDAPKSVTVNRMEIQRKGEDDAGTD